MSAGERLYVDVIRGANQWDIQCRIYCPESEDTVLPKRWVRYCENEGWRYWQTVKLIQPTKKQVLDEIRAAQWLRYGVIIGRQ